MMERGVPTNKTPIQRPKAKAEEIQQTLQTPIIEQQRPESNIGAGTSQLQRGIGAPSSQTNLQK